MYQTYQMYPDTPETSDTSDTPKTSNMPDTSDTPEKKALSFVHDRGKNKKRMKCQFVFSSGIILPRRRTLLTKLYSESSPASPNIGLVWLMKIYLT